MLNCMVHKAAQDSLLNTLSSMFIRKVEYHLFLTAKKDGRDEELSVRNEALRFRS